MWKFWLVWPGTVLMKVLQEFVSRRQHITTHRIIPGHLYSFHLLFCNVPLALARRQGIHKYIPFRLGTQSLLSNLTSYAFLHWLLSTPKKEVSLNTIESSQGPWHKHKKVTAFSRLRATASEDNFDSIAK